MHDDDQTTGTARMTRRRWSRTAAGLTATGVLALTGAAAAFATAASAAQHVPAQASHGPVIKLVAINPQAGDTAGAGGDFTVDLKAIAQNAQGNRALSPAHGYRPGLNLPPATTFGPGMPDPDAPGLVVTLSTTPMGAGGPNANLAGVFQLNSVSSHHGRTEVLNTWEVGSPGFFGQGVHATLRAFIVKGTAPGMVTGHEKPISNVVQETFTIGG